MATKLIATDMDYIIIISHLSIDHMIDHLLKYTMITKEVEAHIFSRALKTMVGTRMGS